MRILTVDDDEIALEMLHLALAQAGHETDVAHNGQEALAILQDGRHRMVITDWEMPGLNGLDLCRAIRNEEFSGYIYTIMLTCNKGTAQIVEGLSAGADDFLVKPFDPGELAVRVRAGERILSLETRDMAIFAMAKLAESRDPETGSHLERVRTYSQLLAKRLSEVHQPGYEIDAHFVHNIFLTCPLHDIGKIGIPDCVLLKPARLSDHEFEIMKTHTTIGAATLEAALRQYPDAKFLLMARDIAAAHHEQFDGTGYPRGLAGSDIPLSARIVALADVYDALTTKRVYKEALEHDIARALIREESGTHFDPQIVAAFEACKEQFRQVQEIYEDAPVSRPQTSEARSSIGGS
jgi:putative two-component system response regulator